MILESMGKFPFLFDWETRLVVPTNKVLETTVENSGAHRVEALNDLVRLNEDYPSNTTESLLHEGFRSVYCLCY